MILSVEFYDNVDWLLWSCDSCPLSNSAIAKRSAKVSLDIIVKKWMSRVIGGGLSTKHRSEFGGPAPSLTTVMSPYENNMIERDQKQQAIANKQNKFPVYVLRICFPLIFAITTEQLCSFVCLSFSYRCIFIRICFLVHRVPNAGWRTKLSVCVEKYMHKNNKLRLYTY